MTQDKDVTAQPSRETTEAKAEQPAIRPAVDIYEDGSGITLLADMPGVSRERLDVHIDGDRLSVSGDSEISVPDSMKPLYADIRATHYARSFSLSRELDGSKIAASLKNGLLTLRIPKREELRSRKIEVRTG